MKKQHRDQTLSSENYWRSRTFYFHFYLLTMSSPALAGATCRPLHFYALHGIARIMTERFSVLLLSLLPLLLLPFPDVLLSAPPEIIPVPDDAEPPPREDELPLEEPCPENVWLPLP